MSKTNIPCGEVYLASQPTATSIDSAYLITADSNYTAITKWTGAVVNGTSPAGTAILRVYYQWDGTNGARYTLSGSSPTTTVGHLIPVPGSAVGGAGTSSVLEIHGQAAIAAFRTIGTASGIKITWLITVCDDR